MGQPIRYAGAVSVFSSRSSDPGGRHRNAPDAVGRGVLGLDNDGPPTLFVLDGSSLGSTPVGTDGAPQWYDLRRLVNLDAIGEPVGARQPVEASFDGGPTVSALWPQPFCDQVVARLRELLESGQMLPVGGDEAPPGAVPPLAERSREAAPIDTTADAGPPPIGAGQLPPPDPAPPAAEPPPAVPPAPAAPFAEPPAPPAPPASQVPTGAPMPGSASADPALWSAEDDRPLPGDGPPLAGGGSTGGELTLQDVVYHGGYPGHTKKRKKCVATMDPTGLTVKGPHGPDFHVGWDVVNAVEAQNADEAKFRIGVKARRRSTVVVFECDQGVTIVIEAQDVPTMPLKSALAEMLGGGSVKVA